MLLTEERVEVSSRRGGSGGSGGGGAEGMDG